MYKQLEVGAELPKYQLDGSNLGLTYNVGGFPTVNFVSIVSRDWDAN